MKVLKALAYAVFVFIAWNMIQGIGMFIFTVVMTIRYMSTNGFSGFGGTQENLFQNAEFIKMIGDIMSYFPIIYIITTILTLLLIMITFAIRKDRFKGYVRFVSINWRSRDVRWILAFGVFLNMLTSGVVHTVFDFGINRYYNFIDDLYQNINGSMFIWLICMTVLVAPTFEEIIFRGIIFNDFKKATRLWVAVAIQALAFGIFHMNLVQGVYATLLGIVLGIVYLKYRSIYMPILLHFSYNATAIIIEYTLNPGANKGIAVVLIVFGVLGALWSGWMLRKHYDSKAYPETYVPYEVRERMNKLVKHMTEGMWFYGEMADDNKYSGESDIY